MWKKFVERYNRNSENDRQLPYEAAKILLIKCKCMQNLKLLSIVDCPAFIHYCVCHPDINDYKCLADKHKCICTLYKTLYNSHSKCRADILHDKWKINVLHDYTFYNPNHYNFIVIKHNDLVIHFTKYIIKLIAIIRNLSSTSTLPNLVIIEIIKNIIDQSPLCIYLNQLTVNYLSDYEINEIICYAKISPIVAENTFENIYNLVDTFDYNDRLRLVN